MSKAILQLIEWATASDQSRAWSLISWNADTLNLALQENGYKISVLIPVDQIKTATIDIIEQFVTDAIQQLASAVAKVNPGR